MNPKALYWIDLETTGLDPNDDHILEIVVARAPFDEPFDVVKVADLVLRFEDWTDVDTFIKNMHYKSGLMLECMTSNLTIRRNNDEGEIDDNVTDVLNILHEKILLAYPKDWEVDLQPGEAKRKMRSDELPVLAGSSVHFDRGFLKVDLPAFSKLFSHRYYDVSALKLFCRSMGMKIQPKAEAHRGWDDIQESIMHARQCKLWLTENLRA